MALRQFSRVVMPIFAFYLIITQIKVIANALGICYNIFTRRGPHRYDGKVFSGKRG